MILSPSAFKMAPTAGGLWSRSDALNNAQREANARNSVLSTAINGLNQDYSNINAPAFGSALGGIPTDAEPEGRAGRWREARSLAT